MKLSETRKIAEALNNVPMIFMTKYPVALTNELMEEPMEEAEYKQYQSKMMDLSNTVKQLEIEKKLFWDGWNLKWVAE